jgi:hypothetical protein
VQQKHGSSEHGMKLVHYWAQMTSLGTQNAQSRQKVIKRHMIIPHRKHEIWYDLMKGWVPNLPRGRGKSIGGDLNVDDKGSEQNIELLHWLHHCFIGYQFIWNELTSPRRLIPKRVIENPSKNSEEHKWIAEEWLTIELGVLQTDMMVKLFLID